jgi:capsular polysaccharide biosynthesis protein
MRPVQRPTPAFADSAIACRFAAMREGVIKPRFVAEFPNGRFWGRGYGYVVDSDDALHADLSPCFSDFVLDREGGRAEHDGLRQPMLPRLRRRSGTVAVLSTLFCENFHHWLLDSTPKLGLLREAGWNWNDIDGFVLPVDARHPWQEQTFRRLGIPQEKIVRSSTHVHVQADRLLVPSYSEPGREPEKFNYTPEGLTFVRELFLGGESLRNDWPRKIVISRELTSCRRWLDGEAGHARLEREGFVKICLERHSLQEQAELFHHARVIVMPTGGGLANLAFCQPGARVIEIFSSAYLPTFSLPLSHALEFEYRALVGHPVEGHTGHSDAGGQFDIHVPVERILEQLS